ncbi:hypothetical protein [Amycolatopsis sp. 195334CR]|uniref:hypothetical protein n=1 Tax=Amycolatopsis sp. 195334CR TaxID=2814588 RepID=UPI001A8E6380|nr:hypothetical protein [Amycolatopsis sp. 195334CR]MBN6035244.1 hypothetical protein [Amycolatopsis sp. 195334CR]
MAEPIEEPTPADGPAIDETAATEPAKGLTYVQKAPEYDPQERLDTVRAKLAFCLMGLLALVIVGAFALAFTTSLTQLTFSDLRLIIELLATPVVTLVGAATGFYFGANLGSARRTGRRR